VGLLHHSCSVAQVPWPGILCHWHLKWFRWGSGGIFALQLLRSSGARARDPLSLVPHVAQVGLKWDFCTTVAQVLRCPGPGSFVTGTSGGSGGAQVGFLHHSCSGAQVAWHGILCHWYLRWLRWGSGGIFAPQLLRCSGGLARDPSSLVPQVAQVATEVTQQGTCRCSGSLLEPQVQTGLHAPAPLRSGASKK